MVIEKINLDLSLKMLPVTVKAKQGDRESRYIEASLFYNNLNYNIPPSATVLISCLKPDKKKVENTIEKENVTGNRVTFPLTEQMLAVAGIAKCDVKIINNKGIISTAAFKVNVEPQAVPDDAVESTDEYNALVDALVDVRDVEKNYTPKLLEVERKIDSNTQAFNDAVANITVDSEIITARSSGVKGKTFSVLDERLEEAEQDLSSFKEDYVNYQNSNNLKIATVEKSLNDYKSTIASVNINQEAKQSATGYGVVSLPKNAANGQVSGVELKGRTLTNLVDMNIVRNTIQSDVFTLSKPDFRSILINNCIKLKSGRAYTILVNVLSSEGFEVNRRLLKLRFSSGEQSDVYTDVELGQDGFNKVVFTANQSHTNMYFYISENEVDGATATIDVNIIIVEGDYIDEYLEFVEGTKSTLCAFRIRTKDDADNVISEAYVIAKDPETNEILQLRSLPNGTNDEVRVSEGKAIINTKKHILQTSDINYLFLEQEVDVVRILLPTDCKDVVDLIQSVIYGDKKLISYISRLDVSNVGAYSLLDAYGYNFLFLTVAKGTYATLAEAQSDLAGTELTYQLAVPIVTPIEVSGNLISYPSGTVYVEPVVADAGLYIDKLNVLHTDLPINYIEKLSKVDFTTGVETELDTSQCVVAEDKLSFTHPDLTANDIVFFTYYHNVEGTQGETAVEYYDSRHTLKDSVTGKFYKVVPTVADGVLTNQLVEV